MKTGFKTRLYDSDGDSVDLGDLFIPRGLFSSGGLWQSGNLSYLSTDKVSNQSSPIQTLAGGTNWKQVSTCSGTTAAIKTDGALWLWGDNTDGQLGDNTVTRNSSPVQTIAGGTNWKQVSAGGNNTAAIKTDGTLWTWGLNTYGAIGDNTLVSNSSPVQTIAGGTNWKQVSLGATHTAAIKTDGSLWLWGRNTVSSGKSTSACGQLGDNTGVSKSSPVQTIAAGTDWKQVSAGSYHTAAIKTDGSLWLWGYNYNGQLGDNTVTRKSSPVQTIAAGTNWKSVSCTSTSSSVAAIKTDGGLWVWGANTWGQLGTNDFMHYSSPVQTIAGGTNWKQVSAGEYTNNAIRDNF